MMGMFFNVEGYTYLRSQYRLLVIHLSYEFQPVSSADFLDEHRRVLESRLLPVIREITDSRARTREELESLYRLFYTTISCL